MCVPRKMWAGTRLAEGSRAAGSGKKSVSPSYVFEKFFPGKLWARAPGTRIHAAGRGRGRAEQVANGREEVARCQAAEGGLEHAGGTLHPRQQQLNKNRITI